MAGVNVARPQDFQEHLLDLFLAMGSTWILYLLLGLSVLSLAVALERFVHLWRFGKDFLSLQDELKHRLYQGDINHAKSLLKDHPSHAARVGLEGLLALNKGAAAAEEMMAAATGLARLRMERGLAFLGTLGNNAPFVGLFGTVLGIIRAFHDLAMNTSGGSSAVMSGIAEALVTTAVGLMVALPAVAMYNLLHRRIRVAMVHIDSTSHVLLAHAKAQGSTL